MSNSSWSNQSATSFGGAPNGANVSFVAFEVGLGKGGIYRIFVTGSGLYGGKLAKQDPKVARASSIHMGLIGLVVGNMMAKKAEQKMAENEAQYQTIPPEDSRFLGIDTGNFRIEPSNIASIEIKSKLGALGWGSDYDCSFVVKTNDGKKRSFQVKKGLGGEALQNLLRGLTNNIVMK